MEPQGEQAEQTQTTSVVVPQPPTTTNKHITASDVPTTKPAKYPARVASGKALAQRNRIAREAKKLQQQQQQKEEAPTPKPQQTQAERTNTSNKINIIGYFIIGVGGLLISALGVYQREAIINAIGGKQKKQAT